MENIGLTVNIVVPVFLIVFIGFFLKLKNIINENFNLVASKIVFNVTLPALIFKEVVLTHYSGIFNAYQIVVVCCGLVASFVLTWLISMLFCHNGKDQGAFIQGGFRSNFAIIGFALLANAYGTAALANAAILLAFIMPLFNLLSVIALIVPMHQEQALDLKKTFRQLLTNPLIIAAMLAIPFSYVKIQFHPIIGKTVDTLAGLTLPLALLSIGGSLRFSSVRADLKLSLLASTIKIVLIPLLFVYLFVRLGFKGVELTTMYFLFGGPTAIVSYIMAEALGSNSQLAGNIILISTLGSVITLSLGVFILKSAGLF